SGEGGAVGTDYEILTIDAPTFFTGINMINTSLAREVNFMHTKVLVFSEEIAKTGVTTYIAPAVRFRQVRRSMHVIVSKCSAFEFLEEYEPIEGNAISKALELLVEGTSEIGYIPHVTLSDFYSGLKSTYRQPIATLGSINDMEKFIEIANEQKTEVNEKKEYIAGELPRKGGGKVEFYGTAVFDGDKMIGELTGEETRMLNLITGQFRRGNFSIEDPHHPKNFIPIDIRMERKPKIKTEIKGGKVFVSVNIILEGDVLAIQSRMNYEEEPLRTVLEDAVIKIFEGGINSLIDKCKEWGVDIFGFGRKVSSHFRTIQEWEDFNWINKFKESEVNVKINFNIRRTGTLLKSSPVITTEGSKLME
ncbi:MAG TPA: Ger(x)C family spore germination protein, partial [Clostridiales bacterium]|nr:Ger(x)C family spore germination protein [Clostridiales bacterium]